MAAYSVDLRKRVLRAWDSGMDVYSVAAEYEVSRAWVHRLVQRRRETGSIEPRKHQVSASHLIRPAGRSPGRLVTARPDATLTELQEALPTTAALSTIWRRLGRFGFTVKKTSTPTNSDELMSPPLGGGGKTPGPCTTPAAMS